MNVSTSSERSWSVDDVLAAVADGTRRQILSVLQARTESIETAELATHVLATDSGESLVDVSREDRDRLLVTLRHRHLPKLADVGLVEWAPDDDEVTTTDHPALRDERVQRILDVDADGWDLVVEAIQPTRRRIALSIVEASDSIERDALARQVAGRENEVIQEERDVESVLATLHHVDLPKFQEAGLVACDDEMVQYTGHPDLDPEWLSMGPEESTSNEDETGRGDDVWTIEGRADVVARGQSLFERAEDELFLMITTDGLLEAGCLSRLEDALERGVDVYLGSQSASVRDIVRERLPEVVIWEPQQDWLNLPPEREKVGRLVFADREAALVGTLGEELDGGYREMAITGTGSGNTLVVLLRELLGDRLDHLDAQSEDFLQELSL